jgi:glutamate carboxypeptidase
MNGDLLSLLLDDLKTLVEIESPSSSAEGVTRAAAWMVTRARQMGLAARTIACPPRGPAALITLEPQTASGTAPVMEGKADGPLLIGHLDTVWPFGTLGELPFLVEGEGSSRRALGPGVFDMKSGCIVALHALARLRRSGSRRGTLLLVPDEEVGSEASRDLLIATARQHSAVLVLEPSAPGGAAKVERKGTGLFHVTLQGIAAHAGLDPGRGASALAALAELVEACGPLNDISSETTVTPTVARAGAATNVVPDRAELAIDCRVWSDGEGRRVEAALRAFQPRDGRVEVSVSGGFDRPPLRQTAASAELFERAARVARELGFELGAARVGGASDGNLTAAAGLPTLDGLGPLGDGAHARHEYVVVDDLPRRVAFIERLVHTTSARG